LWNVPSGKEYMTLRGHGNGVTSVAFAPDGRTRASSDHDVVKLWDVATGKERATLKEHTSTLMSVAFDLVGKTLASASLDN